MPSQMSAMSQVSQMSNSGVGDVQVLNPQNFQNFQDFQNYQNYQNMQMMVGRNGGEGLDDSENRGGDDSERIHVAEMGAGGEFGDDESHLQVQAMQSKGRRDGAWHKAKPTRANHAIAGLGMVQKGGFNAGNATTHKYLQSYE